jgi:hypothetical protein
MEIWKAIAKFDNQYEISSFGQIRSIDGYVIRKNGWKYFRKGKILKPSKHQGYFKGAVCVNKKMVSYKIHRLVAECFLDKESEFLEVNHKNGIKTDNTVDNLEWVTRQENIQHCIDNKLQTAFKGEEVGNSKLKENEVLDIRKKFIPRVYSRAKLAKEYNVSQATIKDILHKRTWRHLL